LVEPTVADCGGGSYEPATLLIVCGVGTTMATGVHWTSWDTTGATGTGNVHLVTSALAATAAARLSLSQVVGGPTGPQFTLLKITWTGKSPDGRATDTFSLAEAP
jgi:hypothetical protein